jgi:hypothetical protein
MCQIRKVDDWDSQVDYIYDILYPRTRTVAQQSKDQNVERSMLNKQIDEIDKLVAKYFQLKKKQSKRRALVIINQKYEKLTEELTWYRLKY